MATTEKEAKSVWNNRSIPVLLRRGGSLPIRLRLGSTFVNPEWLRNGPRKKIPQWHRERKYWELPASRFNELVALILERFGKVYIMQPFRETEVCSPSCRSATGFECECSCMGKHHGCENHAGWFDVTDAFSLSHGDRQVACRLLVKTGEESSAVSAKE